MKTDSNDSRPIRSLHGTLPPESRLVQQGSLRHFCPSPQALSPLAPSRGCIFLAAALSLFVGLAIECRADDTLLTAQDLGVLVGTVQRRDFVGPSDTVDYFRFTVTGSVRKVTVQLGGLDDSGYSASSLALIEDANGNGLVDSGEVLASGDGFYWQPVTRSLWLDPGTYYVRVRPYSSGYSTEYTLTLSIPAVFVTLTLYVHEENVSGPLLPGVRVTGNDAAGQPFDQTTGTGGYVTITGTPGTWSFTASKSGYYTNSWSQSITSNGTQHAFLLPSLSGTLTLYGVRASQRPGTTFVEVDYELGPATGQTATVSVAFSRNDGASFDIVPAANTLSGDVGPGIRPGTRRIVWDAGQSLPTGAFGVNFVARVTAETWGGTARGTSSRFALEVPAAAGGGLQLSGRLLDAATRNPISGAAVSLAGQNTTTAANGAFAFASVSLASGNTLRISKAGYANYTDTVPVPPGATAVTVPDILLQVLPADGRPVVTSLKLRTGGVFLGNVPFANEAVAVVNWNGSPAGSVQFYANGVLLQEVPGAGPSYSCPVNMGSAFRPSFNAGDNSLRVIARTASGVFSDPASVKVTVWPLPGWLQWLPSHLDWLYLYDPLKAGFMIPPQPLGDKVYVPGLGYVGAVFGLRGDVEYYYRSGEWRLYLGAGYEEKVGKPGARPDLPGITMHPETAFYLGNQVVKGRFQLGAHGYFGSTSQPLLAPDILGKFELYWRGELTRYGVLDVFPGLTAIASKFPGAADALKPVSLILYGKVDVEGDVVVTLEPETRFKSFRIEPKIGLEFAYELERPIELRVYAGGGWLVGPQGPGHLLR